MVSCGNLPDDRRKWISTLERLLTSLSLPSNISKSMKSSTMGFSNLAQDRKSFFTHEQARRIKENNRQGRVDYLEKKPLWSQVEWRRGNYIGLQEGLDTRISTIQNSNSGRVRLILDKLAMSHQHLNVPMNSRNLHPPKILD